MKLFAIVAALLLTAPFASAEEAGKIRVLMMTGQNNHDWKTTTPALEELVEADGKFELVIDKSPWEFGPDAFDGFDVVLSNWSVWPKVAYDPWPDDTKAAFLDYVRGGGGLVVFHAGSSVHYEFPEFQALVGRTWMKGKTWHGPKHEFEVSFVGDHPITRGVEPFRIFDELWRDMVETGPYELHAVADTAGDKRDQGPDAPMLMTTKLGQGRGVNLVIGHDTKSIANAGFQTLFLRSLEWDATGNVAA